MTKKMFHAMLLCGAAGVALLCSGCAVDGGYVAAGPVYSDVGYSRPYYGGYGPAYSETVVIDSGHRRGYYADGRRPYRASRADGRRYGNGYGYERSRGSQYGRSRQGGNSSGRGGGQAQYQRAGQGSQRTGTTRPQRGAGRTQQQQEEQGR